MKKLKPLIFVAGVFLFSIVVIFSLLNRPSSINISKEHHQCLIDEHPFQKNGTLSKKERRGLGLPPNEYLEQEYILEMNPKTGITETEKLFEIQKLLQNGAFQKAVPGSSNLDAWVERGPNDKPGRTRAMLYDPNDSTHKRVFSGDVRGGLWVIDNIEDENESWQRVDISENLAVSSIIADPNNSNILYLGTGESFTSGSLLGNGIWKSTDGGDSWSHIFGGDSGEITTLNDANLTINGPSSLVDDYIAIQANGFGMSITDDISGDLVLVDDGSPNPSQACSPLLNSVDVEGKIALIDRGACGFTAKVKNAQDAGAIAVIVVNNLVGSIFAMNGTDPSINIPAVMISKQEGALLKNALLTEVINVTLSNQETNLPAGLVLVPGKFHINDLLAWDNAGTTELFATVSELFYRDDFNTLFGGEVGLYKSVDDGATWMHLNLPLSPGGNPLTPNDLVVGADNTIWLSTTSSASFADGGGRVFSSQDGLTFNLAYASPGGRRVEMAVSSTNPDKMYLIIQTNGVQIKKTTDRFATTPTNLPLPVDPGDHISNFDFTNGQAGYNLTIAVDPNDDEIVYAGGIGTFRSSNGGGSWNQITKWIEGFGEPAQVSFTHGDIHEIIFHPTDSNKGLIASDGGVAYAPSFSGAVFFPTIINKVKGYNTTQFYKGAIGQSTTNEQFLGGAQDNGTIFIDNGTPGTSPSTAVLGGDGMFCFIDKEGLYMIGSINRNVYARLNLPYTGLGLIFVQESTGTFVNQAELDDNLDVFYSNASVGNSIRISRFKNLLSAAPARLDLTSPLLNRTITAMKVSPYTTSSTTLMVGTDSGTLLKAEMADTNPVWFDISSPEFSGSISCIEFGASEAEIMVAFHNYGIINIWFTSDGGTTWQSKEGDFPDMPVKAIMMNPLLSNEMILGTALGAWYTDNFDAEYPNWFQAQNGMQNVKITSFDLRTADNTVLASTYGRGFFTGQFTDVPIVTHSTSGTPVADKALTIFPTISKGEISIHSELQDGDIKMKLYDGKGSLIRQDKVDLSTGQATLSLTLKSGMYIAHFSGEQFQQVERIIIQ